MLDTTGSGPVPVADFFEHDNKCSDSTGGDFLTSLATISLLRPLNGIKLVAVIV
jgi:hypothetical protein